MKNSVGALVKLGRPQNALPPITVLLISYFFINSSEAVSIKVYIASFIVLILSMFATVQNDISDYDVDKQNKRLDGLHGNNPISNKVVKYFLYNLLLVAVLLTAYINMAVFTMIILVGIVVSYLYNHKLFLWSRRPILSVAALCVSGVLLPFASGYALTFSPNITMYYFILAIGLLGQRFSTILLKDYKDYKGDRAYGKKTFLIVYGGKNTKLLSICVGIISYCILAIAISSKVQLDAKEITLFLLILMSMVYLSYLKFKLSTRDYTINRSLFIKINTLDLYMLLGILCLIIL